jgi:pyruvate,water dikinase
MSDLVLSLEEMAANPQAEVGGKGAALARLTRAGLQVPPARLVVADAYRAYLEATGLRAAIMLELGRKDFADMRWEELWDTALRIRNLFMTHDLPPDLVARLGPPLQAAFGQRTVAVRSSALGEDSGASSFAGLHESYVNLCGLPDILKHVRLVWASLWSDAALLYRQELQLDPEHSAMAVVVQEMVVGECSGVAFSMDPTDRSRAVIEAVHGLNQGLVDGTVEPDRWLLERSGGRLLQHLPAQRQQWLQPSGSGAELQPLPPDLTARPPLQEAEVDRVYALARRAEELFGSPQDVEWTCRQDDLHLLQSRPITTGAAAGEDQRAWYLSLRRSFESLQALQKKIEEEILPGMTAAAKELAARPLSELSDPALAEEIEHRRAVHQHWVGVYWADLIPFAHGARLFGQVYNDTLHPADPYEFTDLLAGAQMLSIQRNQALSELGALLQAGAEEGMIAAAWEAFTGQFGDLGGREQVLNLARQLPVQAATARRPDTAALEAHFLGAFTGEERQRAVALLDLGRASWRLRDDDNLYLGRVEEQLQAALAAGRQRLQQQDKPWAAKLPDEAVTVALRQPEWTPQAPAAEEPPPPPEGDFTVAARQLVGQPAGPGLARGRARVIFQPSDLLAFEAGEILVCDALDPGMTFVVPLCGGIVERRGGMLIHGAIIAREYGLACVTGVPEVTRFVHTGDEITVDGYLGIVILSAPATPPAGVA